MIIAYSEGPVCNLSVRDVSADWHRIADHLRPKTGNKDGGYIVRGACAPERRDANLEQASLLLLDGDHGFHPDTGELTVAPSAWAVHEAMTGTAHVITTSHSHRPG